MEHPRTKATATAAAPRSGPVNEGTMELPPAQAEPVTDGAMELSPAQAESTPQGSEVPSEDTFRVRGRRLLHQVAHKEYGVVFSRCGIRTTAFEVEMNPADIEEEDNCARCMHLAAQG